MNDPILPLAIFSALCMAAMFLALRIHRDVFHPLFMSSIFAFSTIIGGAFASMPVILGLKDVQYDFSIHIWMYCVGFLSFSAGCLIASGGKNNVPAEHIISPSFRKRLWTLSMSLATVSWLVYALQVASGGGFIEVYSQVKGRGDLGSGIQDFIMVCVPAAVAYMYSRRGKNFRLKDLMIVVLILVPLLVGGILSSRRGPTAMALSAIFFGYYLANGRRPKLLSLLAASVSGGFFILFLVAYRSEIYFGSDIFSKLNFRDILYNISEFITKANESHEFIYSSVVITNVQAQYDHWWGLRYILANTIWLIPSFIFPGKYEFFGADGLYFNGGALGRDPSEYGSIVGAAPMLFADSYVEFGPFYFIFLFVLGQLIGNIWRLSIIRNGIYVLIYASVVSVMIYLFAQAFTAFSQRTIVMALSSWLLWRLIVIRGFRFGFR